MGGRMLIDGWTCVEHNPGHAWFTREALRGKVSVTADVDGLQVDESWSDYGGGSGRYSVPANVVMWLVAGVR
jgi:hypothetical protein